MTKRHLSFRRLRSMLQRIIGRPVHGRGASLRHRHAQAWSGLETLEPRVMLSGTNQAPTLTTLATLTGATEHSAYTIRYADLLSASNAADADSDPISFRIQTVADSSGVLTKNGVVVTPGTTLVSTGDSLVFAPNASGWVAAFTVVAFDGQAASASPVTVNVAVAAGEVGYDEAFYLAKYADVKAAVTSGVLSSGEQHFDLYGRAEGRIPSRLGIGFDENFYLRENPDVATAVQNHVFISGLDHYLAAGKNEGRAPSDLGVGYNETYYLSHNPDVLNAVLSGVFVSGLEHYTLHGHSEGRAGSAAAVGFDETYYDSQYPDVATAIQAGTFVDGLEHYILFGANEGRLSHAQTPSVTGDLASVVQDSPSPDSILAAQFRPAITITDADSANMSGATVAITNAVTGDTITFGGGYSVDGSNHLLDALNQDTGLVVGGNDTASLTLTGTASKATYQTILAGVRFFTTSGNSALARHVSFTATDSDSHTSSALALTLYMPQEAPLVIPDVVSLQVTSPDAATTLAAQFAPNVGIVDGDNLNMAGARIYIKNAVSGDYLALGGGFTLNGLGHVLDPIGHDTGIGMSGNNTDSISMGGTAMKAVYALVLNSVYLFSTSGDSTDVRHLEVRVSDTDLNPSVPVDFDMSFAPQTPVVGGGQVDASVDNPDGSTIAAQIAPDISIIDADSADMVSGSFNIRNFTGGDYAAFDSDFTVDGSNHVIDSNQQDTGVTVSGYASHSLTFTGQASKDVYTSIFNALRMFTTSGNTFDTRRVRINFTDTESHSSNSGDILNFGFPPQAPTLTGSPAAATIASPSGSDLPSQFSANLTVGDLDGTDLNGATVTLTNPATGDYLYINGYSMDGSPTLLKVSDSSDTGISTNGYDSSTHTITLTGDASLATYQAVLNSITAVIVTNGGLYNTSTRHVDFTVTDSSNLDSQTDTVDFAFPHTTPTLTGSTTSASVTSPDIATTLAAQLAPSLTISDNDSPNMSTAAATITDAVSGDQLTFGSTYTLNGSNHLLNASTDTGIVVTGNNTDTLTLTGSASVATYQAALNAIRFFSTSGDSSTTRHVDFTVTDPDINTSSPDTLTITFPAQTPSITGGQVSAVVADVSPTNIAAQIAPDITINDADSANMAGGNFRIRNAVSGDYATVGGGFTVDGSNHVIDPSSIDTGVVVSSNNTNQVFFTGSASKAVYTAIFDGIRMYTTGGDTFDTRRVRINFTDTESHTSSMNFDILNYTFPLQAPRLTGTTTAATVAAPNGSSIAAQVAPSLTVSDFDGTQMSAASAHITNAVTGDYLTLGGGYTLNGSKHVLAGGSSDTGIILNGNLTTTLSFTGNANNSVYQSVLNAVKFIAVNGGSGFDTTTLRHVAFTITDTDSLTSATDTLDINFQQPPVLSGSVSSASVTSVDPTRVVAQAVANLSVTDIDSVNLHTADIHYESGSFNDQMVVSGGYTIPDFATRIVHAPDGSSTGVSFANIGAGVFRMVGNASLATYIAILNSCNYYMQGSAPGGRNVDFTVTDPDGNTSNTVVLQFIFPQQDPVLSVSATSATVDAPDGSTIAAQAAPSVSITDIDSANMSGAHVTISNAVSGDTMMFSGSVVLIQGTVVLNSVSTGISASGNGTGEITLSGTASKATYAAVLNTIQFFTTSADTVTTRDVDMTVTDTDTNDSVPQTIRISFAEPPALGGSMTAFFTSEPDSFQYAQFAPQLTLTDSHSVTMVAAEVKLTDGISLDNVRLDDAYIVNGSGHVIRGSDSSDTGIVIQNETHGILLTGNASIATYLEVLDIVRFGTLDNIPTTRHATFTVTDSDGAISNALSLTVQFDPTV